MLELSMTRWICFLLKFDRPMLLIRPLSTSSSNFWQSQRTQIIYYIHCMRYRGICHILKCLPLPSKCWRDQCLHPKQCHHYCHYWYQIRVQQMAHESNTNQYTTGLGLSVNCSMLFPPIRNDWLKCLQY